MKIDSMLVRQLIKQQFPKWADLDISPVKSSGWDNRTFHLGRAMSVRLPSGAQYSSQVQKEQFWLPKLQAHLPLAIPAPIAMGEPSDAYPWHWSIYQWLDGETASYQNIQDLSSFSKQLACFLNALQRCDSTKGPAAGPDNFYRGGDLSVYDNEVKEAIANVENRQHANIFSAIWARALKSAWQGKPVWVHGDVAVGNLLVRNGDLSAVIDFGQLAVGDPACDLALYWTFFTGKSRDDFKMELGLDAGTWDRGRAWVLWKTLCAPIAGTNCKEILKCIIEDFNSERGQIYIRRFV